MFFRHWPMAIIGCLRCWILYWTDFNYWRIIVKPYLPRKWFEIDRENFCVLKLTLIFILFADSALATNFICVIIKSCANTTTRSVWCSLRWRTTRYWNVTQVEACRALHRTSQIFPRQTHRLFSRTGTTMGCYRIFHRHDLKTMTWTTTRTAWTGSLRHSELPRTWSRSSRPTEI